MKKSLLILTMALSLSYAEIAKEMTVYKTPYCGCCTEWIAQMKEKGFNIKTIVRDNFDDVKAQNGLRPSLASCHTALIDGYVIEGHVDFSAIKRLLSTQPKDVLGLSVPGMVVGSPGMEMGDKKMPYDILAIKKNGAVEVYESH